VDLASYAELAVRLVNGEAYGPPLPELRGVFDAAADGAPRTAVAALNALLDAYPIRPQVTTHDGGPWHLHLAAGESPAEQLGAAALGLAQFVTAYGIDRLGRCAAAGCARVYLDTSTNRSRRYCGDRCASRANVAAYRARRRASTPGDGQ